MPFAMVGDAAFPLKKIFNEAISRAASLQMAKESRARKVVECAFGILAARWRVLHTRINLKPENVDSVVMTACILHNYLLNPQHNQRWQDEAEERGNQLTEMRNVGASRGSREACDVREELAAFFSSPEGRVSWQDHMI